MMRRQRSQVLLTAGFMLAGCSAPHRSETEALRERLRGEAAYRESPAGSAADLARGLPALVEPEPPPDLSGTVEVEPLVRLALSRNPALRAAVKRFERAIEQVPQAASAPDPEVRLGVMTPLPGGGGVFEQVLEQSAMLMQMTLWPGKLKVRARVAAAAAHEAAEAVRESALALRLDIIRQVVRLHHADESLRFSRAGRQRLDRLAQVIRGRYETGLASQEEALSVRVRLRHMEDRIVEVERERREAEADLGALLGARGPLSVGPSPIGEAADGAPPPIETLLARAFGLRPDVAAMTHRLQQALSGLRLAELDWYPDLEPRAEWRGARGGADGVGLAMGMRLAFLRPASRAAAQRQARAALGESAALYEETLAQIAREVASAYARLIETHEALVRHREQTLPESRAAARAALAALAAGSGSLQAALDAELSVLAVEEHFHHLLGDHLLARETLRRAMGEPPDGTEGMRGE